MPKKLFIFNHGVGGNGHSAFFDSSREKLEERGIKSIAPSYPNPSDPDFQDWVNEFHTQLNNAWNGEEIVLIGHSLGGFFTLRLLGECYSEQWTKKLVGIVLVSPTATKRPKRRKIYAEEIKWDNILKLHFKLILFYSEGDDHVSPEHSNYVVEKLGKMEGFEFRKPEGYNHFIMATADVVDDAIAVFL